MPGLIPHQIGIPIAAKNKRRHRVLCHENNRILRIRAGNCPSNKGLTMLPNDHSNALLLGRVQTADGPSVVTLRDGRVLDITSSATPTMRDLMERDDLVDHVRGAQATDIGSIDDIAAASTEAPKAPHFLPPADLQAIKAAGVTFAESMVERVIEEQAAGNPDRAQAIRTRVQGVIGDSLAGIVPGSDKAMQVKDVLQKEGLWSQYLEVGIGPDAEVFTKCQPMSSVGWGAAVGLHPVSTWNNPEPEIVLAVSPSGHIVGATLGNDVNLRDVEGRSALLLGKAKDNNASCSIGPVIRLFDGGFTLDDVRAAHLTMTVAGTDGFDLTGASSMAEISRDPADLVAQTIGAHHQYPDGI